MDDIAYWLALTRAPGVGPNTFLKLLKKFGSPRHFFESDIINSSSLPKKSQAYLNKPDWQTIEKDLQWAEQENNHIITLHNSNYPPLLKEIPGPPPILFVKGDPALLQHTQLAMVGSRNPTHNGKDTAFAFAKNLTRQGFLVTSGLALGIDAASHAGALAAMGQTIAVLGTGLDRIYPARHHNLATQIAQNGALVSEFVPGTPPVPANFPRRNRIISGLSIGTLVVEANIRSGSLITARMAADQGREVFAIPGPVNSPLSRGCHKLINEGAKLVETTHDIIGELGPAHLPGINKVQPSTSKQVKSLSMLSCDQLSSVQDDILHNIGLHPTPIDSIVQRTGMPVEGIISLLMVLELQGKITSSNGCYYKNCA